MIHEAKFTMPLLTVQLRNKLAETEICLSLNEAHRFLISGFPRCLYDDIKDKAKTIHPLAINNRRWAGRSIGQQMGRKAWVPPDPNATSRAKSILNYSDPSHGLGYATSHELRYRESLARRPLTSATMEEEGTLHEMDATSTYRAYELDASESKHYTPRNEKDGKASYAGEGAAAFPRMPEMDATPRNAELQDQQPPMYSSLFPYPSKSG
ncbi:hypothetical protein CC80DRAFT_57322 [Byssothecium circinans]|uniref:Uncharacterized protein n=1 Tax=Byssothecium circinans TaxID=147558 RepID=A0A6A5TU26_9PLEO|nr:hypothetical protein CC80DRAFT_57322 [Byssothecium circinans]